MRTRDYKHLRAHVLHRALLEAYWNEMHILWYKQNLFIQSMRIRFCVEMVNGIECIETTKEKKRTRKRKRSWSREKRQGTFIRECELMKMKHIHWDHLEIHDRIFITQSTRLKNVFGCCWSLALSIPNASFSVSLFIYCRRNFSTTILKLRLPLPYSAQNILQPMAIPRMPSRKM